MLFPRQPSDAAVHDPQLCIVAYTTPESAVTRVLDIRTYPESQICVSEDADKKYWSWDELNSNTIRAALAKAWRLTITKEIQELTVDREQSAHSFFSGREGPERIRAILDDIIYTIELPTSPLRPPMVEAKEDQAGEHPELDITLQLEEMRLLENGWLDGEGLAPLRQGIDWLERAFRIHYSSAAQLPYLFPTVTGGVQAEWSIGARAITLEIDLTTQLGQWHELCLESGVVVERSLDCNAARDWEWLVHRIEPDV